MDTLPDRGTPGLCCGLRSLPVKAPVPWMSKRASAWCSSWAPMPWEPFDVASEVVQRRLDAGAGEPLFPHTPVQGATHRRSRSSHAVPCSPPALSRRGGADRRRPACPLRSCGVPGAWAVAVAVRYDLRTEQTRPVPRVTSVVALVGRAGLGVDGV